MSGLRIPSLEEFLALRPRRYSAFALAFDDPDRPLPDPAAEASWWNLEVGSGRHRVALFDRQPGEPVAIVHAFAFDEGTKTCEVGFALLSEEDAGRGWGRRALTEWLGFLAREVPGLGAVTAETNAENAAALAALGACGFHPSGEYQDGPILWLVLRKTLERLS